MPTLDKIKGTTHSAKKSLGMIRSMGNVKYFEVCEISP